MDQSRPTTGSLVSLTELSSHKDETVPKAVGDLRVVPRHQNLLNVRAAVRRCINYRNARNQFLPGHLFADPAWDMLLALYEAQLDHVRISTSNLGETAAVPATTALRWVATLVNEGLVERHVDPLDARRNFVKLSANGLERITAYFDFAGDPTGAGS